MDSEIDRRRLIVPGMAGIYQRFAPYSYAFMRFVTGAILVPHGINKVFNGSIDRYAANIGSKGIPFAELLAYLVFFTKLSVGAFCLAIGLFTRIAAAMIGMQMLVIAFMFQWKYGYFLDQPRVRVRADVGAALRGNLVPRRRPLFGRPLHRQGILNMKALLPLRRNRSGAAISRRSAPRTFECARREGPHVGASAAAAGPQGERARRRSVTAMQVWPGGSP